MSECIVINEVGPRDGLQSQDKHLTVAERASLIKSLLTAGLQHI
ncbi:MAG: hydroxymethylglutaryl-CoA lyase, partial [Halieaceae bacterium]|nr:hydroxymethylglutaryl-CoA lyase [Halieaceae bacterium]